MGGGRPARCVTLAPLRVLTAPTLLSLPAFLSSLPASGRTSCHQQPAPVAFFARATNRAGLVPYASRCVQGVPHAAAKGRAPPSKSLAPFYSPRTHFFLFSSRTPFVAPHTFLRLTHPPSPRRPLGSQHDGRRLCVAAQRGRGVCAVRSSRRRPPVPFYVCHRIQLTRRRARVPQFRNNRS